MTSKTLIAAAASGLLLMGCAYPWLSVETARDCQGQNCEVAVSGKWHDWPVAGCFVDDVAPYELRVRHARPMNVHWYLDSHSEVAGFRFASNGIVFDDAKGWKCDVQAQGTRFMCVNTAGAGRHKYTVNLVNKTTKCEAKDPWVFNE